MTRVLAVGYPGVEFLDQQAEVHLFPESLERDDLEQLVDLVADDLGDQRAVLAVYPSWWSEPALRRLQTVRCGLDASRMLLYPSPLPPLAGSVFCALAASVGPHMEQPGVLYAGLKLLERQVLTVARLRKVSGLREPAPSIWQHAAGWWPRAAFGVSWWPRPSVRRLRKKDPSVPLPPPAAWSGVPLDRLAVASGGGSHTDWVERTVAAPLNVQTIVPAPLPPLAGRFWGTTNLLEVVAYPTDIPLLVSWLSEGSRASRCPWCGEQVVGSECPFCHMDRATAFAVGEAV